MINFIQNMFSSGLMPEDISVTTFKEKMLNADAIVLDVRTPGEFQSGHISKAKNISYPSADFERKILSLDKNKTLLVYCRSGNRSKTAGKVLLASGFKNVLNLSGGISAWNAQK